MKRAACTIVSPNYLPFARTLAKSFLAFHPDAQFFVCIVANTEDPTPFQGGSFEPVMLHQLGIRDQRGEAMKYDILEFNTNVKPGFLRHLIKTHDLDSLIFLDPDISLYTPLDLIFEPLEAGATAVVTPHMTSPIWDGQYPSEQALLFNGTFNLGFIGVGSTPEALRMLDWWDVRTFGAGFSEGRSGLFEDQKWINLIPGLFDRVVISRDVGINMAYWNLHDRTLRRDGDRIIVESPVCGETPLRFFHFSGVVIDDPTILSKYTARFTIANRPDLAELFSEYTARVREQRAAAGGAEQIPYGYEHLSDGTSIGRLARRLYAAHYEHFEGTDPFDANGPFARWAKAQGLVAGKSEPPKRGWEEFNARDRRVDAVHKLLKVGLRILGPHRYELLMRYLGHITILRNQGVFIRDPRWTEGKK